MSNIAIKGATTGTGVFTLESPATNTDRTLILPDEAGTVLTSASSIVQNSGPAFSVHQTTAVSQTLTNNVDTKIIFNAKTFDTANAFDNATNYRFQPTIAGYYLITVVVSYIQNGTGTRKAAIFRNGSEYNTVLTTTNGVTWSSSSISAVVYLNGSTDYIEGYGQQASGGNLGIVPYSAWTRMTGVLVRAD